MNLEDYNHMVKNTGWLLSANLISRIFTAIFIILLANHLLPADFGLYNFAFSTAFIISVVPEFGFDALIVRKTSKTPDRIPDMASDVIILRVLLSIIILFFLLFISRTILGSFDTSILILAFLVLLFEKLSGVFLAIFRSQEKMEYQSYVIIFWKVVYLVLGTTGILLNYELFQIILLLLISSIFQFTLSIIFYLVKFDYYFSKPDIIRWRSLIYLASPFTLFSLLSMFYGHITILLLNIIKGDIATGIFSAGWKLIIFLGVIPHSFGRALFPFFTKLFSSKSDSLKKSFIRSTRNLLQISVPITIILYLITPEIIIILFTGDYTQTINVFRILVWMIPFLFMNGCLRMALWSTERTIETSKNLLYSSILLLITSIIFIQQFGVLGASAAVVFAEIIYFFINQIKISRDITSIWNKDILYTFLILIFSILSLIWIQDEGQFIKYLFIILFLPTYILTLYRLKAIKKEDFITLRSFFK